MNADDRGDIPRLGQTDGVPFDEKTIHQIWTIPSVGFIWCVAELDHETGRAFGYANLGDDQMAEWGYIDTGEIRECGAERVPADPMPFGKVRRIVRPSDGCPRCGSWQYGFQSMTESENTPRSWVCRNCRHTPLKDTGS